MNSKLLLFASVLAAPSEPLGQKIRAAIWHDLEVNGMIGSGNEVAASWLNYYARDENAPVLRLEDLDCAGGGERQRCEFSMVREGGVITVDGEAILPRIACKAPMIRNKADDTWEVSHSPPRRGEGHSRTAMRCKFVRD